MSSAKKLKRRMQTMQGFNRAGSFPVKPCGQTKSPGCNPANFAIAAGGTPAHAGHLRFGCRADEQMFFRAESIPADIGGLGAG